MTATGLDPDLAYDRLVALLDSNDASYRIIDHDPEGRTEIVSRMRGNVIAAAAKCMVVMVKLSKKQKKCVLAVVPGDRRVDLNALRTRYNGTYASLARPEIAERLTGCLVGTVLPFSWNDDLELVVDPALYQHDEIYFNAGRLDRSLAISAADHKRIADATEVPISILEP